MERVIYECGTILESKREVPRDVRNSKSPETKQVQERLVSTLEQMQVQKRDRTRWPEE